MAYTTPTLVEAELRAASAFSATTLPSLSQVTTWIEEESADIDNELGYTLASTQYDATIDYDGADYIYLKVTPVITVDTLLYNTSSIGSTDYSTSWEEKTEDTHFYTKKGKGMIAPIFKTWTPTPKPQGMRIIYTAGYTTTPAIVQKLATKMVTERVLTTLLSQNVNDRNDGGSISVGSINIVEPTSYGVGTYKQLKSDISDLYSRVVKDFGVARYYDY
jgi:hypothetical protein